MTFYFFKCSNKGVYLVVDKPEIPASVTECEYGKWLSLRRIEETGEPRIAFSEERAKQDIADHGYHLIRVTATTVERVRN